MAALLLRTPKGSERFPLGPLTQIGRSPECDVVLNDVSISRRHATVRLDEGGAYTLTDEQSRFGTFVNGEKVETALLRHGDEVKIGNVRLSFEDETQQAGIRPALDPLALRRTVAELETRVHELQSVARRSQALLGLQDSFARCTSPGMLLQGAGPYLVRAMKADRCALLLHDREARELLPSFHHQLNEVPASRWPLLRASMEAAAVRTGEIGADQRLPIAAPLPGADGSPEGLIYVELPPGRTLGPEELELFNALRAQVGTAVSNLGLIHKVRREEQVRQNLARYVSDQVADAVLAGRLSLNLGGEQRRVTVLFSDVRGFTALSERLAPEHVLQMLNEYFGQAVPVVKAAHGTVDKFIGDAMMAVFGAPNELPDHELRAVKAAAVIQERVARLRQSWQDRPWARQVDLSQFAIGVGINTGLAVAGNLGTEERREYAVIGDAVNVASRLCSQAKANEILIGADTAKAVGAAYPLDPLGEIKVKGRAQPVPAFRVLR